MCGIQGREPEGWKVQQRLVLDGLRAAMGRQGRSLWVSPECWGSDTMSLIPSLLLSPLPPTGSLFLLILSIPFSFGLWVAWPGCRPAETEAVVI